MASKREETKKIKEINVFKIIYFLTLFLLGISPFFFFFFSSCVSALCHLKVALLDSQLDRWVPFSCDNAI